MIFNSQIPDHIFLPLTYLRFRHRTENFNKVIQIHPKYINLNSKSLYKTFEPCLFTNKNSNLIIKWENGKMGL
jgi:hypothetical protein